MNLVKSRIYLEKYLSRISNVKHHQAVTRFRTSAHKYPVESGRYLNIAHDSRACTICNFSKCNNRKLTSLRNDYLNKLIEINSLFSCFKHEDLFIYCISMNDDSILNLTAKYLYDINVIFNDCICNN